MHSNPTAKDAFSLSPLLEVPSLAPVLAAAHAREWGHLDSHWNESVALSDFESERKEADLPTTWVAHHSSHGPLGSVSLVMNDLPVRPGFNPWLASLYVFPKFRGRGLGEALVQKAVSFLCLRNYPEAFLFTENRVSYFSRLNFAFHGHAQAEGHAVTVMKWTNPAHSIAPPRAADQAKWKRGSL